MKIIIEKIISLLGRENYKIDQNLHSTDLIKIVIHRFIELMRGFYIKIFIKSNGIVFCGRGVKLLHANKIQAGKSLILGDYVKINALSKNGIKFGNNVSINAKTFIECTGVIRHIGEGLRIGNNVGIAQNCFIQVRGLVEIGNNVIFGPHVSIFSENHNFDNPDLPVNVQGETRKGVKIEDGVWVGTRAVILDGVVVGKNSIVAAGSIVNKNVPPYSIVGGVPAKVIKMRK